VGKGEKRGLDGNLIIEGEKLIALCKRFLPPFPFLKGDSKKGGRLDADGIQGAQFRGIAVQVL